MFESLKTQASIDAAEPLQEATLIIPEASLDFLVEGLSDLPPAYVAQTLRRKTRDELNALIGSIETFGLSRALLRFANYNGKLGAAVQSIPALESMTEDVSVEQSQSVLAALKAITIDEPTAEIDLDPAEEGILNNPANPRGAFQWITVLVLLCVALLPGVILNAVYIQWNFAQDRKKHIFYNIPYELLLTYLKTLTELPEILKTIAAIALPKTEAEYTHFLAIVAQHAAPLKAIGIHVGADATLVVDKLKSLDYSNIDTAGYVESSMKTIAENAIVIKGRIPELKSLGAMLAQARKATKSDTPEEIKYSKKAAVFVENVAHAAFVRMSKILRLTKRIGNEIRPFYKKAD